MQVDNVDNVYDADNAVRLDANDSAEVNSSTTSTTVSTKHPTKQPVLQWKTKTTMKHQKRPRRGLDFNATNKANVLQSEFSMDDKNGDGQRDHSTAISMGPLIIPVIPDQNKWKQQRSQPPPLSESNNNNNHNSEDVVAIQALHDDATMNDRSLQNKTTTTSTATATIPSHANTFVSGASGTDDRDVQQYHKDMKALPAALDEMAEEYQRTPIAEFGAALLRGMGWQDDEQHSRQNNNASSNNDDTFIPRPHRLGLGAIPAMINEASHGDTNGSASNGRRPRNIDQYERDQRTQKQQDVYRIEREKKIAEDLQRTIQDGSIVRLLLPKKNHSVTHHQQQQRARIMKLVGVPGLNMVQVKMEQSATSIIVKRNEIDRLVTREELEQSPFHEEEEHRATGSSNKASADPNNRERSVKTNSRHGERSHRELHDDRKARKRSRKEENVAVLSWVIPNIRVRIVSEKLGRHYYKEKGIVVDVTRHDGITVKMNTNSNSSSITAPAVVLDRIPERYLETALPKIDGNVIIVNPHHINKYAKGRLLERDSSKDNCIVQLYEEMDCVRLSLDDIAEWCGPLDDDII